MQPYTQGKRYPCRRSDNLVFVLFDLEPMALSFQLFHSRHVSDKLGM